MLIRVVDSEKNLIASIEWQVYTDVNGQLLERFIDSQGNVYLEEPRKEVRDCISLMEELKTKAIDFYQIPNLFIEIGRML